jgi:hypothetical protein
MARRRPTRACRSFSVAAVEEAVANPSTSPHAEIGPHPFASHAPNPWHMVLGRRPYRILPPELFATDRRQ